MKKKWLLPIAVSVLMIITTGLSVQNVLQTQQFLSIGFSDCPDDFYLLADTGGFAPWSNLFSLRIHSNGNASYYTMIPENREYGTWTYITSFQFTKNEMDQLWNMIVTNNFFTLQNRYCNGGSCGGTFANLTIKANQETHSIQTENIDILEFDNIIKKINELTPGDYDLQYNALLNNAPWKPSTPTGETQGKIRQEYTYRTQSFDFDYDDIYYFFDWGDETTSGWLGPYQNHIEISVSHVWNKKGDYNVKVKAIDDPNGDGDLSDGMESQWSDYLPISMPYMKTKAWNIFTRFSPLLNDKITFSLPIAGASETIETVQMIYPTIINAGGTTATYEEECKITVKIQICLCGSWVDNASQVQINTLHTVIKNDFMSRWNRDQWDKTGPDGKPDGNADGEPPWRVNCTPPCDPNTPGCTVHFNITVSAQKNMDPKTNVSGWHTINIPENKPPGTSTVTGWDTDNDGETDDCVEPNDGRQTDGNWSSSELAGVYAHECGHLMGLLDQYVESTINIQHPDGNYTTERSTYPKPGKKGNIMAETSGYPDQNDINTIVGSSGVICPCKCCPIDDQQAPDVNIILPQGGAQVSSPLNVTFEADDSHGTGVAGVQIGHTWESGSYKSKWFDISPPETSILATITTFFDVDIQPGDWIKITIYAKDVAGNIGIDTVDVTLFDEQQDTTPPITEKSIGQPNEDDGYIIWPFTPITLSATDDLSGVKNIHYEIWWDSDEDMVIDKMMALIDISEEICMFSMDWYNIFFGLIELRWCAVDNVGNIEPMHTQQHMVTP